MRLILQRPPNTGAEVRPASPGEPSRPGREIGGGGLSPKGGGRAAPNRDSELRLVLSTRTGVGVRGGGGGRHRHQLPCGTCPGASNAVQAQQRSRVIALYQLTPSLRAGSPARPGRRPIGAIAAQAAEAARA